MGPWGEKFYFPVGHDSGYKDLNETVAGEFSWEQEMCKVLPFCVFQVAGGHVEVVSRVGVSLSDAACEFVYLLVGIESKVEVL